MPLEHKNITNADLHEPLGVSAAVVKTVYIANGAGSGDWNIIGPHGGWRYTNIGTGTTFTTPTAYTLMNVVGVSSDLLEFTNNSLGRLTYTGTRSRHIIVHNEVTFKHSIGSGQDVFFEIYKNGIAQSAEIVVTADSANYQHASFTYDTTVVTNDYIEVYLKVSTGSVIIHQSMMFISGLL